ncbi:hypothetical protein [Legionella micdadei]|uniref:Uncharacterized protein n=1 Tax=Legionella micdadei TaxID=451 RepID=A0A098GDC1_LEGMI|nr:hypothetical protein [Legionella micdadei]ARG98313.1 hypothetical protein B6N58_11930 [Legionella micdadei]ARH01064.1 hypothetical protein B6V88_11935 [Legionella micdadei]KTD27244.1 hypothetical protein Lmic_2179 [Legionella micdadei]NSL18631.1 hypothetical protein [Legionella micdadei]CEG60015.1 protein of unknown function [Legionella micdadei]
MKLYHYLSEAIAAFQRKPKEVFAIISLNSKAYFVFRSNPDANTSTIMQAHAKMVIGNELKNSDLNDVDDVRKQKLYHFMINGGVPQQFPRHSQHAEENLIRNFPNILKKFKAEFPNQKINTVEIFLTHSPCSSNGQKRYSAQCYTNNFFLPPGCDKKLSAFFKKENYKYFDQQLFNRKVKVRIHYNHQFDPSIGYDNHFIKEADPILKKVLCSGFDNRLKH